MTLSIIICTTGNRSELISCLQSLKKHSGVEVLVINNSRKKLSLNNKYKVIKVINEYKPGLSYARNTGWKKAKGDYIAYIDDDSIADKDWIKNILKFIEKNPEVKTFGGPYKRHSNVPIPSWIPNDFGTLDNGTKKKKLNIGTEWLSGTNMVFKKELLREMGGFNPRLGMNGKKVSYGEETDLQIRIANKGVDIWYDPSIKVSHLLDERKIKLWWVLKDSFIRGVDTQKIKENTSQTINIKTKKQSKTTQSFSQKTVKILQLIFYAFGVIYQKIFK